jgi:hypothetical protein
MSLLEVLDVRPLEHLVGCAVHCDFEIALTARKQSVRSVFLWWLGRAPGLITSEGRSERPSETKPVMRPSLQKGHGQPHWA